MRSASPISGKYLFVFDEKADDFVLTCEGIEVLGMEKTRFWCGLKAHAKEVGLTDLDLSEIEGFEAFAVEHLLDWFISETNFAKTNARFLEYVKERCEEEPGLDLLTITNDFLQGI